MARQDIDIGVEGNDGTGDSIRESFRKVNENFTEIYPLVEYGSVYLPTSNPLISRYYSLLYKHRIKWKYE